MASLTQGFIVYVADNVLVMLMACTAGTLGANLFSNFGFAAVLVQVLGMLFNTCLAVALYSCAASRLKSSNGTAGKDDAISSVRDSETANYGSTESAEAGSFRRLVSDIQHDAYSHIIQMLPWVIIVPMVNIPISISDWLWKFYESNPYSGNIFVAHFVMVMVFLLAAVILGHIYAAQPDSGSKFESMSTFLLNSLNHATLSSAGKSLHLLECVIFDAVVGNADQGSIRCRVAETSILLALAWFFLAHSWPRLSEASEDDKLFKSIVTAITVYSWAFSFINNLWNFFYLDVTYGQVFYWAIMFACLLTALCLASFSEHNFYGGPSRTGKAFGLMLCWVIDFGVWWAWDQYMTDIDTSVHGGTALVCLVNGIILLALIATTTSVYVFADVVIVAKHSADRIQRAVHKPKS